MFAQEGDPIIVRLLDRVLEMPTRTVLRQDLAGHRREMVREIDLRVAQAETRLLWSLFGSGIGAGLTVAGLFVAAGYFRRKPDLAERPKSRQSN